MADYLKQVFDKEGIPAQIVAIDPNRSNIVARLKGNGKKRPLLILGHTDVVTVDAAKWSHRGRWRHSDQRRDEVRNGPDARKDTSRH